MYPNAADIVKEGAAGAPERKEKFTPGPWEVDGQFILYRGLCGGPESLAVVETFSDEYKAEQNANVSLIAAAPELYEALKAMTEYISAKYPWALSEPLNGHMKCALDALARARGEK